MKDLGLGRCESPNLDMARAYGMTVRCRHAAVREFNGVRLCGAHCGSFFPPASDHAVAACKRIGADIGSFAKLWVEP